MKIPKNREQRRAAERARRAAEVASFLSPRPTLKIDPLAVKLWAEELEREMSEPSWFEKMYLNDPSPGSDEAVAAQVADAICPPAANRQHDDMVDASKYALGFGFGFDTAKCNDFGVVTMASVA